jgi:hypothetical protein
LEKKEVIKEETHEFIKPFAMIIFEKNPDFIKTYTKEIFKSKFFEIIKSNVFGKKYVI